MGFDVSASFAVIVVGTMVSAIVLCGALSNFYDTLVDGLDDDYEREADARAASVAVAYHEYDRADNTLTLHVVNNGDSVLDPGQLDVLLDGLIVDEAGRTWEIAGKTGELWCPGDTLVYTIAGADLSYSPSITSRLLYSTDKMLASPGAMTVVGNRVYVIDGSDHIDVFDLNGTFVLTIGDAGMTAPGDISGAGGFLYVLDGGAEVDRYDIANGTYQDGYINNANMTTPVAIHVSGENAENYVYIVDDQGGGHIDRCGLDGTPYDNGFIDSASLSGPEDVCVTDYIYVLDGDHVDRFELDGTGGTEIVAAGGQLSDPKSISVADQNFSRPRMFIVDGSARDHIDVYDVDGTFNSTIDQGLSANVTAAETAGDIFVSDANNGLAKLALGTRLKVVTGTGESAHEVL